MFGAVKNRNPRPRVEKWNLDARMDGRSTDCEAADEVLFLMSKSVHRKWSGFEPMRKLRETGEFGPKPQAETGGPAETEGRLLRSKFKPFSFLSQSMEGYCTGTVVSVSPPKEDRDGCTRSQPSSSG